MVYCSKLESLFESFVTEDCNNDDDAVANVIGLDGIEKLCKDVGIVDIEDIRVLFLVWKLGGGKTTPGTITKAEFVSGCEKLDVDSIDGLKKIYPSLDLNFLDESSFKDFYKFCYQFNLQGTHKFLEKDIVLGLWPMLLKTRVPDDRVESFCKFVKNRGSCTHISLDQYVSFLSFCNECKDLSDYYEETSAWPVLIDEYMDRIEELKKLPS